MHVSDFKSVPVAFVASIREQILCVGVFPHLRVRPTARSPPVARRVSFLNTSKCTCYLVFPTVLWTVGVGLCGSVEACKVVLEHRQGVAITDV